MDRMKIAEELRVMKGDIITAEGVALKAYLPADEQRTILAALVRRAHLHVIAVYKELVKGDEKLTAEVERLETTLTPAS